ncbi:hypothetical protein OF83DRAFT_776605 [Amylostereum chailletii]|nr:hypothetical protein OF83DRAFT_776605 [Amylostereum chailletii]
MITEEEVIWDDEKLYDTAHNTPDCAPVRVGKRLEPRLLYRQHVRLELHCPIAMSDKTASGEPQTQKPESAEALNVKEQKDESPAPDSISEPSQPTAKADDSEDEDEAFLDDAEQSDSSEYYPEGFIPRGAPAKPVAGKPRPKPNVTEIGGRIMERRLDRRIPRLTGCQSQHAFDRVLAACTR